MRCGARDGLKSRSAHLLGRDAIEWTDSSLEIAPAASGAISVMSEEARAARFHPAPSEGYASVSYPTRIGSSRVAAFRAGALGSPLDVPAPRGSRRFHDASLRFPSRPTAATPAGSTELPPGPGRRRWS